MSAPKQPSAAIRTLKAKLQLLKRPTVWGSTILLLLPLVFLANYWSSFNQTSDASVANSNTPANTPAKAPSLTDPSSLMEAATLPQSSSQLPQTLDQEGLTQSPPPQSALLDKLLTNPDPKSKLNSDQAKAGTEPTSSATGNTSELMFGASGFTKSSRSGTTGIASSNRAATSPLQSALNRSGSDRTDPAQSSDQPGALGSFSAQTSQARESTTQGATQSTTQGTRQGNVADIYGNSSQAGAGQVGQPSGFQPYTPQTSPTPGTTGYTVPPAFRTPANTSPSGYPSSAFGSPQTAPIPTQASPSSPYQVSPNSAGYGTTYQAPSFASPQPVQQQAPFSVPRTPPGRSIGNGEINTFSNP
jgi:hypothetical protein